jgi:hypothetical protein
MTQVALSVSTKAAESYGRGVTGLRKQCVFNAACPAGLLSRANIIKIALELRKATV